MFLLVVEGSVLDTLALVLELVAKIDNGGVATLNSTTGTLDGLVIRILDGEGNVVQALVCRNLRKVRKERVLKE